VLQVVSRLHDGDILYRDVFAGVPPLAFAVASASTRVFGLELVALRIALIAVITLSYLMSADLLWRLCRTRRYEAVLAGMMLVWALPADVSLYQPLANLCLLVALDAIAWWGSWLEAGKQPAALPLLVAGVAAGLSFLSKQTTGAYAMVAVMAAVAVEHRGRRSPIAASLRDVGIAGGSFALAVVIGIIPVAVGGAWPAFIDYAFLNKGTYLSVAGISYVGELAAFVASIRPSPSFDPVAFVKHQPLVLPLLLVPALAAVAYVRRGARLAASLLAGLALAEAASIFPRADLPHVVPAAPGMLVVLLAAWHAGAPTRTPSWKHLAEAACVLVVAAGIAVQLAASVASVARGRRVWSGLPHLRHVLVPRAREAALEAGARALRAAAPSGRLFLLTPDASLHYLVSGVKNPTPFDYPLISAFGLSGEADLVRAIDQGRLREVCMAPVNGPLAPARLQQAVVDHLSATADLGPCVLYTFRE
jgi:hypothetical protein